MDRMKLLRLKESGIWEAAVAAVAWFMFIYVHVPVVLKTNPSVFRRNDTMTMTSATLQSLMKMTPSTCHFVVYRLASSNIASLHLLVGFDRLSVLRSGHRSFHCVWTLEGAVTGDI
jgi:hypothetical protein